MWIAVCRGGRRNSIVVWTSIERDLWWACSLLIHQMFLHLWLLVSTAASCCCKMLLLWHMIDCASTIHYHDIVLRGIVGTKWNQLLEIHAFVQSFCLNMQEHHVSR